jgi:hypothetical protein
MKKNIYIAIAILAAFLSGKYLFQAKRDIKTVVKYVEVEKRVEKKASVVKSTKIEKPDGTIVTETTVTENTQINTDISIKSDKSTVVKGSKLTLGALAIKSVNDFGKPFEYGVTVAIPVFGAVKAQWLVTTDKRIGVGLAVEF